VSFDRAEVEMELETQLVTRLPATSAYRSARARAVSLLGPLTVVAGIVWAILQPARITLLHPLGRGFWDLAVEAPLLVIAAGVFFALAVARQLVADLEAAELEDDG
jgi:hypothetical protein